MELSTATKVLGCSMITELKNKIEYWTEDRIDNDFYKGLTTHTDRNMKYAIEKDSTGFYVTQRDSSTYFNLNTGVIYRIDCRWTQTDIACNNLLYERSIKYRDFKIDIPVDSKFITINGKEYWYSVVQRPMNTLGVDCNIDIGNKLITVDYIKEWVDHSLIVLQHIKEVSKICNSGMPANGVLITNRVRLADNVYAWKTFKRWHKDIPSMIEKSIDTLKAFYVSAAYLQIGGEVTPELIQQGQSSIEEILMYASKRWNTLIK